MTAAGVVRRIVSALDRAGIPHMLTGSFAAAQHGVLRATQDIDFVIAPTASQLRDLAEHLPPGEFYFPIEAALEALRDQTLFNVIDLVSGWKVDFIIRKSRPFSRTEFDRRRPAEFTGVSLHVATVEDVIVSKLEWAKQGGSRRQLDDVAGLVRRQRAGIDMAYVERWVAALGLEREWGEATRLGA